MEASARARQNQTKLWRIDTSLGAVELLRASYVRQCFRRHFHDVYAIGVIEEGALGFNYRGEQLVAPAASISTANPGEVHDGYPAAETGWTYRMFYLDANLLRGAVSEITGGSANAPLLAEGVIHDAELAPRIRQTHRILEDQNVSQLEREALLLELLMEMIRRHSVEGLPQHHIGGDHRAIRKVKDYMQAHSSESISLAALAGVAQLSPYYLSRLFRQEAGIPLQSYLPQVRVHHAKRLLASGKPIVFAAQEAGFSDQSHLTRWFKRILGITPGQYLHSRQ